MRISEKKGTSSSKNHGKRMYSHMFYEHHKSFIEFWSVSALYNRIMHFSSRSCQEPSEVKIVGRFFADSSQVRLGKLSAYKSVWGGGSAIGVPKWKNETEMSKK